MKKNNKGFTLVELIVVLVILAILAAILVPALLGYIDKARNSQYEEEAHSILTAVQAKATEDYARTASPASNVSEITSYVNPIVTPTNVKSGAITYGFASGASATTDAHASYTVKSITNLEFQSQKGASVICNVDQGAITIIEVDGVATGN